MARMKTYIIFIIDIYYIIINNIKMQKDKNKSAQKSSLSVNSNQMTGLSGT
jgi:hypothetical protein